MGNQNATSQEISPATSTGEIGVHGAGSGKPSLRFDVNADLQAYDSKVVKVYDISQYIKEAPAVNNVGLLTVQADEIFPPGTVFMGMGIPNVYLAHVYGPKSLKIVAAKSLYREETKVVETGGRVQSGLLFVACNVTPDEIEVMRQKAHSREGKKNVTCLNESMNILSAAGIGAIGLNITDFILPHNFLHTLLTSGIYPIINGRKFEYAIVKTTPKSLDEYYGAIKTATMNTPIRHLFRSLDSESARQERKSIAIEITKQNEQRYASLREMGLNASLGPTYTVLVSETTSLGAFFRSIWGTHVICKIQAGESPTYTQVLNELLPTTLKEFDRPNLDFFTRVKKNLLFNESVVDLIRYHMTYNFDRYDGFTQHNIMALMNPESDGNEKKYNFVVTGREVIIITNSEIIGFVDWILSKHVLISGYSPDVRFAGELWLDSEKNIHINNNSGTYRPTNEQLVNVTKLANMLFPDLKFVEELSPEEDSPVQEKQQDSPEKVKKEEPLDPFEELGWVDQNEEDQMSFQEQARIVKKDLSLRYLVPLKTTPTKPTIGVILSKFDPLTIYHENTIESALSSGVFDKIVVVPSDVTTELIHTPLIDRQNIVNLRYCDDSRVITFMAHSIPSQGQILGWVKSIINLLRTSNFSPVSVFLWEDYSDPSKRSNLVNLVDGDQYLVLYDSQEDILALPEQDEQTGRPIIKQLFQKPPKSSEVRDYLSSHGELFKDNGLLKDNTLPLSDPVRQYIYKNQLYNSRIIAGNITDAFRNTFGTSLGKLLGRVPMDDKEVEMKVLDKLQKLGITF